MQEIWLHQKDSENLILFYAGWALGGADLIHMHSDCDVLMLRDYRDESLDSTLIARYGCIDVVAYSMGVAVAARQARSLHPRSALALCGAVNPRATIGARIYDQTAEQLCPQSLAQFARRAGAIAVANPDIEALQAELRILAHRPADDPLRFDRVLACTGDRIFTPAAMRQAWPDHPITWIDAPHMPFQQWHSWQELLA